MFNLFQISDPHFGKTFDNEKQSRRHRDLNIHDFSLCRALQKFFDDDVYLLDGISAEDPFILLMNGDLTSKGHEVEFQIADTFLHSKHAVISKGRVQMVGLNWSVTSADSQARYAGIPGNHDHGSGWWVWPLVQGHSSNTYRSFLDAPPFVKRTWCREGLELCIFGIDSCSMYEEMTLNLAPGAAGGFSKDHRKEFSSFVKAELRKPLPDGCDFRTAAILCHHPWSADGSAGTLCPSCVAWLHGVASECGIPIVMTGHTHYSFTQPHEFTGVEGQTKRVREVRCPTTLQTPAQLNSEYQSPGLWWHSVYVENNEIVWDGSLLLYSGNSFYTAAKVLPQVPASKSGPTKLVRETLYQEKALNIGQMK